jgi:hypothetical protein
MNICATSAFRNSTGYLARYFAQMGGLQRLLDARGDTLYLVASEGDHADDTRVQVRRRAAEFECTLISYDHCGADYGSVVNGERFAMLAKVWSRIWAQIPDNADVVLFVESDLMWQATTMLALIDRLREYPAMAPMVLLNREDYPPDTYYDVWGYRKDGLPFNHRPPFFYGWPPSEPVILDSAGSCIAMHGWLARQLTWPEADVVRGVCKQIHELGHGVWIDCRLEVFHP